MTEEPKPKSTELVYRASVRLSTELERRAPKDGQDFVRRKNYRKTGKPENGLSVFRKDKFPTLQALWDRMGMSSAVGVSECIIKKLDDKGLKFILGGEDSDRVSVRCPDCDMKELPQICKPKEAKDHWVCAFFGIDTFDLNHDFQLVEAPAVRKLTTKKTK